MSTFHVHCFRSLPFKMTQGKDFSASCYHYCLVENIHEMSFLNVWDAHLYHVLHNDTALPYSSRYKFYLYSSCFVLSCECNYAAAVLTGWVNLLKLSARCASWCNQRTLEKYLADVVFVLDKKLVISFSVVTLSSVPYLETANRLQYENSKFRALHCPCQCRAL